jgi:hypothetical protein
MPGAMRQRERGIAPAWVNQPVIYPVCTKIAASVFPPSLSSLAIFSIRVGNPGLHSFLLRRP